MAEHRALAAIDRDLRLHVDRLHRAKAQISRMESSIRNDDRAIDRLLDERHAAAAAGAPVVPVVPAHPGRVAA